MIYFDYRFQKLFSRLKEKGVIKPFDDEFYRQFDGMLYNVTPVDYYIKYMSMGKCFDASAVLGLAFGKRDDVFICRGNLRYAGLSLSGKPSFGHGWVEKDGMVYDTTWQIICPREVYYKLFGAKVRDRRSTKQFFKDCEALTDFNIHDKKFYEECFCNYAYCSLIQMLEMGALLTKSKNEKSRLAGEKLLNDLPDMEKVYSLYKKNQTEFFKRQNESCEESSS